MKYGVSYYPEQKTAEELRHDLKLLKESGINTVRMGEFAWSRMEPVEGQFQFDWLDAVIEELFEAGIRTIVCTPTACPPSWLISRHPEILYVDNRRIKRPFGGRRHYCYNHPVYREYCRKITEEIAVRYGHHPAVSGFQIDNEPAQEGTGRCCCPVCREKFQGWMKAKYQTIEAFNERSGSVFWSQELNDFSQLEPPVNTIEPGARNQIDAFYENPTVRLDFERFSSESQISFQDLQTAILKSRTKYPVTTNGTGLATLSIDYYQSTRELDVYGFDYYPELRNSQVDSFPYAFARGIKGGRPFWILEFMSGGGHRLSGSGRLQPNPGALKQSAVQAFAHGAELLLHFQFRSFLSGAEQLNYAVVDMDGVPRRRYFEMQETAALLNRLSPLAKAGFASQAGILFDFDTHWSLRIKPVNDPDFSYPDFAAKMYHRLAEVGIDADVLSYDSDFSAYRLLVLPTGFVMTERVKERLKAFVENGGILLATFLTAVKNPDNQGDLRSLPAGMTDLFGVVVEEVEPVFLKSQTRLKLGGREFTDHLWSELLSGDADCLGSYIEEYKQGSMVVSRHSYGKGQAFYVGTDLTDEAWRELFLEAGKDLQKSVFSIPPKQQIEIVRRVYKGQELYFLFNFANRQKTLELPEPMVEYLSRQQLSGEITLERNGFAILLRA